MEPRPKIDLEMPFKRSYYQKYPVTILQTMMYILMEWTAVILVAQFYNEIVETRCMWLACSQDKRKSEHKVVLLLRRSWLM